MLRNKIHYIILVACVFAAGLLLVSCHSTKGGSVTGTAVSNSSAISVRDHLSALAERHSTQSHLTAKVKVTVDVDGKSISTSGSLKMKRNDVIQISLVDPLIGAMELGRIEFTKTKVLIIDRVNKQYIDVPYNEVDFLKKANLNFDALQALFWNEVFTPGKSSPQPDSFTVTQLSDDEIQLNHVDKMLAYQFTTRRQAPQLDKTHITNSSDTYYTFDFTYSDFIQFEGKPFPKGMAMSFVAGNKTTTLALSLSSMRNSSDWLARTSVPKKYDKADPEQIFNQLIK